MKTLHKTKDGIMCSRKEDQERHDNMISAHPIGFDTYLNICLHNRTLAAENGESFADKVDETND